MCGCTLHPQAGKRGLMPLVPMLFAAVAFIGAGAITAPARAQATPVDFELEGRVLSITPGENGAPNHINLMGVDIIVPAGIPIHSPVASLTFADLLGSNLPGRGVPGFLQGVATINGETINGVTTAQSIEIEPSENVLSGAVTANQTGAISILGVPVMVIGDWRMHGTVANEDGFPIDITTVALNSFAVAEGYLGDDGVFYAHTIEADGTIAGPSAQTSITRAICHAGQSLHVRGASTTPTGFARVYDNITGALLATVAIEPNADNPTAGLYRVTIPWENTACVTQVRVENSNGSQAVKDVEIQ